MIKKETIKRVHLIGIEGVAMTALAVYLKEKGISVTGSDVEGMFPTNELLKKAGITVQIGFFPERISQKQRVDLVVYTGAHEGRKNPEVVAAMDLDIPVMSHGEALGYFMDGYEQISVAGSHGKTTTSAMIVAILTAAGRDPSYAVGCGDIRGVGNSGHSGSGNAFIAEADEYVTDPHHDLTPRFLWQHPDILVVTNIDYDHPDVYASLAEVKQAFITFQKQVQGKRITIVNADDPESSVLTQSENVLQYGFTPRADLQITRITFGEERTFFSLSMHGISVGEFVLKVPGKHNVSNAAAAALAAVSYGCSWDEIKNGLLTFGGTKRRFEKLGEENGIAVFDDYAHHPHEIQATLKAARAWFPKRRIIVVFQPHTYSRTKALLPDFAKSFDAADMVLLTDIFASARETDTLEMSTSLLVEETAKHHANVRYTKDVKETRNYLMKAAMTGDVIITMGAGDIFEWGPTILSDLQKGGMYE